MATNPNRRATMIEPDGHTGLWAMVMLLFSTLGVWVWRHVSVGNRVERLDQKLQDHIEREESALDDFRIDIRQIRDHLLGSGN